MVQLDDAPLPIDTSLLAGLSPAMSQDEQKYVTELLTSGDVTKLAQAARVLSRVADLAKQGIMYGNRDEDQRSSITKAMQETGFTNEVAVRVALLDGRNSVVHKIRLQEAEVKALKRLHPLPARMPRQVIIQAFDPDGRSNKGGVMGTIGIPSMDVGPVKTPIGKGPLGRSVAPSLKLADDTWDGTVSDAFAKIHVKSDGTVDKKEVKNLNEVASFLFEVTEDVILKDPTPRVVIADAANDAAQKGLHNGDIITHVNGEELWGKSSEHIISIFRKAHQEGGELDIVVNAEVCVAEALRVRSIC